MIRLENIQRRYVSDEVKTTALADINLHVEAGEFVAIMGPSGCGKSTLLNTLGTVDRPTGGKYLFGERDLAALDEKDLAKFRGSTLGFVFQSFNLLPRTTALDNVALPLLYRRGTAMPAAERRARAAGRLKEVGLAERGHHQPSQLSGGQQQRVAIARALVNDPALLLADEPTGALDSRTSVEIMALFQALNQRGITIVLVTHEPDIAAYASRKLLFRDGKLVSDERNPAPRQAAEEL